MSCTYVNKNLENFFWRFTGNTIVEKYNTVEKIPLCVYNYLLKQHFPSNACIATYLDLCNNSLITNYEIIMYYIICKHGAWFLEVVQHQLVCKPKYMI